MTDTADTTAMLERLNEMAAFLDGSAPMDCHWFGDETDLPMVAGRQARYWWRTPLRELVGDLRAALAGQADAGGQEAVAAERSDAAGIGSDGLPFSPYIISEWAGPDMKDRKVWTAYNAEQMRTYRASASAPMPVDALPDDIAQSMKFYGVDSLVELARIQSQHVERLQAKLPPSTDNHPRNPRGA